MLDKKEFEKKLIKEKILELNKIIVENSGKRVLDNLNEEWSKAFKQLFGEGIVEGLTFEYTVPLSNNIILEIEKCLLNKNLFDNSDEEHLEMARNMLKVVVQKLDKVHNTYEEIYACLFDYKLDVDTFNLSGSDDDIAEVIKLIKEYKGKWYNVFGEEINKQLNEKYDIVKFTIEDK